MSSERMQAFPPPPESRVTTDNWFMLPHMRDFMLGRSCLVHTMPVWRGNDPASPLEESPSDLGALRVAGTDGASCTLEQLLAQVECDALLVMHGGRIVYERYLHAMQPHQLHFCASVSKSVLALVAGIVADAGGLDLSRQALHYVEELRGTALGSATLRQLLDMQAGIRRPELAPRAEGINRQDGGIFESVGLLKRGPDSPADLYEFIRRRPAGGNHGDAFYYDNGPPEALAWVLRRQTGKSIAELLSDLVWQPLGMQRDAAYVVDDTLAELTAGGLFCTLRDLARIGELLRRRGDWHGRRIVGESFIQDIQRGGSRDQFARTPFQALMPGGSYRSFFWVAHDAAGGYQAGGRFGQRLLIAPGAELVVAQFGSAPGPWPHLELDRPLAAAYRSIIAHLAGPAAAAPQPSPH